MNLIEENVHFTNIQKYQLLLDKQMYTSYKNQMNRNEIHIKVDQESINQ